MLFTYVTLLPLWTIRLQTAEWPNMHADHLATWTLRPIKERILGACRPFSHMDFYTHPRFDGSFGQEVALALRVEALYTHPRFDGSFGQEHFFHTHIHTVFSVLPFPFFIRVAGF